MASLITNTGLQTSLDLTFGIGCETAIDAMGISDFGCIAAGTTTIAAATNKDVNSFDATPTRCAQTVSAVATFSTSEGNFTITTITLHNDGAGAFTGVYGGIDNQSITKTTDFTLTITMNITYTSV